jgi:hypothetical protein
MKTIYYITIFLIINFIKNDEYNIGIGKGDITGPIG